RNRLPVTRKRKSRVTGNRQLVTLKKLLFTVHESRITSHEPRVTINAMLYACLPVGRLYAIRV
ncbi:MAG: hypothetical protein KKG84_02215, partial [Candidatus Omnitrophica bacterium]|nr:hypothetical protein [Candidatus Omnitrophota bacterium]